ncbi:dimethyladenosine transferase 1, mitochondrial-like [Biomphalaria glabrata]|uniref:rRNA adenine N(6)-methyltransferase n=1 Tax=Biomphalaria glabrata TaxID=6526 RepID=A0A2C9JQC7_BIOGL|nr:dimethyladenosine transferase 1, mitochondrial-like [Biomphalaria glabrata]XP_013077444.1 dimethyladenosine transferase 1, mitochondrial-like [Biomphalaria glabrata]XP_013077445.1 dimethyladenosine transferase 1, mitochondrial-like [Biomphalaria glabrata]XP_013077447.1 dimethyladenosine transferase 1, mitochondrial-like [Biomphalaria glabrata]XP_055884598.1 dimethyladenosine transferase 1, mitochondrial-like [Biomphalaria glabrata]XP_055884599.1 dimethyladenosine transferase 1, mitochondria
MQRLPPLPSLQEIIRIYGLSAQKKLSQNFLLDMNLTKKIVRSAGKLNDALVIEVGPGPGGITRPILNSNTKKVIVIEKDRRFLPSLQILAEASSQKLEVVHGDILSTDLQQFVSPEFHSHWQDPPPNIHIIGNLPFSVSTPLIIQWLHHMSNKSSIWKFGRVPLTLTFQKEVAERIVAPPKSEYRCRLSVMSQYLCDAQLKFSIQGKAFVPPPKVDVGVVHFVPKVQPLIQQNFTLVEKVNRHLFQMPNKYYPKPLSTLFPLDREDLVSDMVEKSGINVELRAFELTIEDIGNLCNVYAEIVKKEPDIFTYDFRSKKSAKERRKRGTLIESLEEKLLSNYYVESDSENVDVAR